MALLKPIKQDDGVVTSYHRILFLKSDINSHTSIAILSYIDEEGRQTEKLDMRPYKTSISYVINYVENMTIEDAYAYLKTLPEFEGAEDI